jgi:HK97 family phage portal protein
VPPFAVTGNFQSPGAMKRAADDLHEAVLKASKEERQALVLPLGLDIKEIGASPDKMQFVELKRFLVEEVARIYSMPPNFVQDLSKGTFSNTEQQDLHLVKHTLRRWVTQIEQELNLKLFGRSSTVQFVEFNLDGILRGDFKTRMEGYAQGIQNSVLKPNEARRRENLPDDPDGGRLLVQGATVPLGSQGTPAQPTQPGDPSNAAGA